MHLCDLDRETATRIAQKARPAINPIGDFPRLLKALESALCESRREEATRCSGREEDDAGDTKEGSS